MKAFGMAAILIVTIMFANMVLGSVLTPGVLGEEKPATEEIRKIIEQFASGFKASDAVKNSGVDTKSAIEVLKFKSQTVAGINYFVEVRIAEELFLVKIFEGFDNEIKLVSTKGPIQASDEIDYFP